MSYAKLSSYPAAATPTGSELVPAIQSGANVNFTANQLAAFAAAWTVESANFTATANRRYLVDTSAGALTATLPSTANVGDCIQLIDVTSCWNLYNLTITPAGSLLVNGNASNYVADGSSPILTIVYTSSGWGWRIDEGRDLSTNSPSAVYLPNYRAAVAKVVAGTGRCRILMLGDSVTAGVGAGTGTGGTTNCQPYCMPTMLAKYINSTLTPANVDSIMCDYFAGTSGVQAFDPRVVLTNWVSSSSYVLGGDGFQCTTSGGKFAFTPVNHTDTADIYTLQGTSLGTVTVNVNGGSTLATINQANSTWAIVKTTVTFTAGANTINIVSSNGSTVYLIGIVARLSTLPSIDIINAGASGMDSSYVNTDSGSGFAPSNAIASVAPNLTVINIGGDDFRTGGTNPTLATYITNMQAWITACKATGDVMLMLPNQPEYDSTFAAKWPFWQSAVYTLAKLNGCPILNTTLRFGTWAAENAAGMMYDNLHPNALGYSDVARYIATNLP